LDGLADFLQDLRNQGMHPFLTGDISEGQARQIKRDAPPKPYIVARK